jgi:hypothetical protein
MAMSGFFKEAGDLEGRQEIRSFKRETRNQESRNKNKKGINHKSSLRSTKQSRTIQGDSASRGLLRAMTLLD